MDEPEHHQRNAKGIRKYIEDKKRQVRHRSQASALEMQVRPIDKRLSQPNGDDLPTKHAEAQRSDGGAKARARGRTDALRRHERHLYEKHPPELRMVELADRVAEHVAVMIKFADHTTMLLTCAHERQLQTRASLRKPHTRILSGASQVSSRPSRSRGSSEARTVLGANGQ